MNIRLLLSWLLAVPMFLLLLGGAFLVGGSLILLAFHGLDSEHLFFVTGSFFYLFCAHLLYFGSYFAYPPLYDNRLKFIALLLHSKISLLVWGVIYVVTIGYCFHYFKIL